MKRLKNRFKTQGSKKKSMTEIMRSNDIEHVHSNDNKRSCSFCHNRGHFIGDCPKIKKWNSKPIKDKKHRTDLG